MSQGQDRFYNLLPALYRQRDWVNGEPLRALLDVLEGEYQALEGDLRAAYDNWFIQTCDVWAISYIAGLVGVRKLDQIKHVFPAQRRQVANAVAYRRRKGTLAVLEHACADVTGWVVGAAEYSRRLARTQHVEHFRPDSGLTVDVHDPVNLLDPDGPFSTLAYTPEVRRAVARTGLEQAGVRTRNGRYGQANAGVFVWRLRSYHVTAADARPVDDEGFAGGWFYTFHPLGGRMRLFNRPEPAESLDERVGPQHVPMALDNGLLAADLAAYRRAYSDLRYEQQPDASRYFGPTRSLNITWYADVGGPGEEPFLEARQVKPSEVVAMDLSAWESQPAHWNYEDYARAHVERQRGAAARVLGTQAGKERAAARRAAAGTSGSSPSLAADTAPPEAGEPARIRFAIDVCLGRLVWLGEEPLPYPPTVSYSYGFPGDVGGGPYHRTTSALIDPLDAPCQILVAKGTPVDTLGEALKRWAAGYKDNPVNSPNLRATIRILDSGIYREDLSVELPPGAQLSIIAESGMRPTLVAASGRGLHVRTAPRPTPPPDPVEALLRRLPGTHGASQEASAEPAGKEGDEPQHRSLYLKGLWMGDALNLSEGVPGEDGLVQEQPHAGRLQVIVEDCTLMPGGLAATYGEKQASLFELTLKRSISGPLRLPESTRSVRVLDGILDGGSAPGGGSLPAFAGPGSAPARPSALSGAALQWDLECPGPAITLNHSTVFGPVHAECIEATEVIFADPVVSVQPEGLIRRSYVPEGSHTVDGEPYRYVSRGVAAPVFSSRRFDDPDYAQLDLRCTADILTGADDGSELGVFHGAYQAQADQNLKDALAEFLPLGTSAGIYYVS